MSSFDLTDMLLGVVSVLLAVSTFYNGRKKDSKNAGAQEATFHADLRYIKELLQDVRSEMKVSMITVSCIRQLQAASTNVSSPLSPLSYLATNLTMVSSAPRRLI